MKDETIVKVSISIPKSLLSDLDDYIKSNGYNSRTKGLVDMVKKHVEKHI